MLGVCSVFVAIHSLDLSISLSIVIAKSFVHTFFFCDCCYCRRRMAYPPHYLNKQKLWHSMEYEMNVAAMTTAPTATASISYDCFNTNHGSELISLLSAHWHNTLWLFIVVQTQTNVRHMARIKYKIKSNEFSFHISLSVALNWRCSASVLPVLPASLFGHISHMQQSKQYHAFQQFNCLYVREAGIILRPLIDPLFHQCKWAHLFVCVCDLWCKCIRRP